MCMFSTPKAPPPPPVPLPQDANQARVNELQRRAAAKGFMSTISPGTLLGTSMVNPGQAGQVTAPQKTLLGM